MISVAALMEVGEEYDCSGQVTVWRGKLYAMYCIELHCGQGATCVLLRRNAYHAINAELTSHKGNIASANKDWSSATAAQSFPGAKLGCRQFQCHHTLVRLTTKQLIRTYA
jgi:hypothetical protein